MPRRMQSESDFLFVRVLGYCVGMDRHRTLLGGLVVGSLVLIGGCASGGGEGGGGGERTAGNVFEHAPLAFRGGERPDVREVISGAGVEQVTQQGAAHLQDELFERARGLEGVRVRTSIIAGSEARALTLEAQLGTFTPAGFIEGREFMFFQPPDDGSIHMALPPDLAIDVLNKGWGQRLDVNDRAVMIYGPRDRDELEIIWGLAQASYDYANSGLDD